MGKTNVIELREFNEVVRITNRKIEAIEQSDKKTKSLQIEVGELLIELRNRINAGEIGELAVWWEWFEENRMLFRNISQATAEAYMQIAGAPDPEKRLAKHREQGAARQEAFRHKSPQLGPLRNGPNCGTPPSLSTSTQGAWVGREPPSNVTRIPAAPTYPSSPEDDALVEQFIELFRKMTDGARVRAMQEINALYRRWREGEE
jgi:hypothetical protein